MADSDARWHYTIHEKKFLLGLGTYHKLAMSSRLVLLKKYLHAMKKRVRWGDVNQYEIKAFVLELIGIEEEKELKNCFI